jgi:UDP-N-acetylmuramate--alanine ligase
MLCRTNSSIFPKARQVRVFLFETLVKQSKMWESIVIKNKFMDLSKIKKAYFIGIKGVGMTMLAEFLANLGVQVSGSDVPESFMTDAVLAKIGAQVQAGFDAGQVPTDADLIVYSTAYNDTNPEVAVAKIAGRLVLTYAEAMAKVFNYRYGVAVCGSHGKTTTTAWLGFVLDNLGLKPSVMVGSRVPQFDGAGLVGESDLLVIEADEYQNKLQHFEPKAVLLNNIDYDHPDYYANEQVYEAVFADFVAKIPAKGWLVANFDDEAVRRVAAACRGRVISYGLDNYEAELQAVDLAVQNGRQFFRVLLNGDDLGVFNCQLVGKHNVANALAVIAASLELGADLLPLREALAAFSGTARRLEQRGVYQGAIIYDDYAHHPTEVAATIAALKDLYPDKSLTVVFHPHTFSRTKAFLVDFAAALSGADNLGIIEVYGSAREEQGGVSSRDLLALIREQQPSKNGQYLADLNEAKEYVTRQATDSAVVVLMGAGDVFRVADALLAK